MQSSGSLGCEETLFQSSWSLGWRETLLQSSWSLGCEETLLQTSWSLGREETLMQSSASLGWILRVEKTHYHSILGNTHHSDVVVGLWWIKAFFAVS